jgi:uncharacterized OsmC-like protein
MSTTLPPGPQTQPSIVNEFEISIEQIHDYEFRVRFDKEHYQQLELDEPAPLGADRAPNASRILSAAIGNCLSASLLFCATKARVKLGPIRTTVKTRISRNERGRLRVASIDVEIDPGISVDWASSKALQCLDIFEDYCTVTESVRQGIDVHVNVKGVPKDVAR